MPEWQDQAARRVYERNSSRAVIFDPTDHELFVVQAQGFDWQLLQNGSVHRYRDRFGLDTASAHLADLDYVVHRLDAGSWLDVAAMHTALATALFFPGYYGRNLDALNECLGDVGRYSYGSDSSSAGTVLAIAGFDSLLDIDRPTALGVLDIFARHARLSALYGHAMLCLIETVRDDLGKVGGTDVFQASVAEFPPDPPEPFDESTIIEFGFQFYATADEADDLALRVESATAPILDEIGRYCTRVDLASERAGQSDERHSSSSRRRAPGQDLYEISIATRGVGDRNVLGERIFEAVTGFRLPFEQMSETPFGGPLLADALEKYPSLDQA